MKQIKILLLILLLSFSAFAQRLYMPIGTGVTTAYTLPTANMVGHWDASDASSVHISTGVSQWDNLYTGSSPTPLPAMTQTVTANQPVYSGSGMTAKIAFDGSNDYLRTLGTYNQPITLYIVFKTVTNRANDVIFDGGINGSLQLQQAAYPNLFLNGVYFSLSGLTTGVFQVVSVVANSSGTSSMTCQGSSFNNLGGGSPGGTTMGGLTIGARVGFFYSIIEVQEIVAYNINHSTTSISLTQSQIISYLRAKWGI